MADRCISLFMFIAIQNKLEFITGIPAKNQQIVLYNSENDSDPITTLSDDTRPLGFYSIRDYQVLKVYRVYRCWFVDRALSY